MAAIAVLAVSNLLLLHKDLEKRVVLVMQDRPVRLVLLVL
jgi:hypothetical protein